jgi:hypothetical protein
MVEHGIKLAQRVRYDPQHLRRRRLLLERLGKVGRTLAQLVQQSRVLDGDHRLGGEILDHLDLLGGEGADLLPVDGDGADQLFVPDHRHGRDRARAGLLDHADYVRGAVEVDLLGLHVGNMHDLPGADDAKQRIDRIGRDDRLTARGLRPRTRCAVQGDAPECAILVQEQVAELGVAEPGRVLQDRVEHGFEVARRPGNDAQHLRRRGLLVARLLQLAGALFELVPQFGGRRGLPAAGAGRRTAFRRGGLAQPRFRRLSARSPTLLRRLHHGSATCRKCRLSVAHPATCVCGVASCAQGREGRRVSP